MNNAWCTTIKPRRGKSADRYFYESRGVGDWDSIDADPYGYSSGGYDRIHPVWSTPELKPVWTSHDVNPNWSSPDISYRPAREVLVNPWFPVQEPSWIQPEVSWSQGAQEKKGGGKGKSIQRSKSFSLGLLSKPTEDISATSAVGSRPLARSNSQVHLAKPVRINFQGLKNQFADTNSIIINNNNNSKFGKQNVTKIEIPSHPDDRKAKPRILNRSNSQLPQLPGNSRNNPQLPQLPGLNRSNSQLPQLPNIQKKISFLRRLGSRAGKTVFKDPEKRFSVVLDGGRRMMVEEGDRGRMLLLEEGAGKVPHAYPGKLAPPYPGAGRIQPSQHSQEVFYSSRSSGQGDSEPSPEKSLTESLPWKEETTRMVSRRAILSRSRDDLNLDDAKQHGSEDQWFSREKLYKDHIVEVLEKWDNIDDEIWAKVIVLERNRRIAKAYARAPVLTVNGSDDGFDGFRIGVNGFDNPLRDPKTEEFKKQIGTGCKLKMDDTGNILVKRLSKANIYVKNTLEENAVSNDILKLPSGQLEAEKPFKLFDMKKFQQNVNRELKRQYPERQKLESQCISTISFVKNEAEVLDSPIWVMLINVVALEMLKAKMPRPTGPPARIVGGGSAFPSAAVVSKKPVGSGSSDEDPYSLTPSGSSGSSGKGPRGPDRKERDYYGPQNWAVKGGVNDLSDEYVEEELNHALKSKGASRSRNRTTKKPDNPRERQDDPYYHGLSARVTAFGRKSGEKNFSRMKSPSRLGGPPGGLVPLGGGAPGQAWWHSRLYPEGYPEMPGYHDGGRGNAQIQRNRFASPSRPTIFRTGWE